MSKEKKFKIYIAVYLVLSKNGRILLLKRKNTGYQEGNYSLVAGHLDGAETAKQGIVREAKEEANIILSPQDLKIVHVMHRYETDREYIDIYLSANKWSGKIKNMEPEKCDDLNWFQIDNLPDNIVPEVKFALNNINKNIFYGEIGWDAL